MVIKKIGGKIVAMEVGLFSFCVRFITVSYIRNSALFMCTQLLHAFGYGLFWAAVIEHTKTIAREEIYMTTFTLVSGLYYGFGGLAGNMLAGFIYHRFSGEVLFLGMGVACGVWVVMMVLYFQGVKWICRQHANGTQVRPSYENDVI